MSRTASLLSQAQKSMSGVLGRLALAIESERGVTRSSLLRDAARLRETANKLEELANGR